MVFASLTQSRCVLGVPGPLRAVLERDGPRPPSAVVG